MLYVILNYFILSSVYVDVITDLHMYPYEMPHELVSIKENVKDSDFIVYNGDFFDSVECPHDKTCNLEVLVTNFLNYIEKPFMFTLGNHDGEGDIRNDIIDTFYNNSYHIGICNARKKACRHPTLNIVTLDSNTYHCEHKKSYGCPFKIDVNWINDNLNNYNHSFMMLFTHIPPPIILGKHSYGIVNERPSCWTSHNKQLLPYTKPIFHIYGHDHNNLYMTVPIDNTTYINALKTGDHRSYGPNFGDSGITHFKIENYTPILINSISLDGVDVGNYNKTKTINYYYCNGSVSIKNIILAISVSLVVIGIVLASVIFTKKKKVKLEYKPLLQS